MEINSRGRVVELKSERHDKAADDAFKATKNLMAARYEHCANAEEKLSAIEDMAAGAAASTMGAFAALPMDSIGLASSTKEPDGSSHHVLYYAYVDCDPKMLLEGLKETMRRFLVKRSSDPEVVA